MENIIKDRTDYIGGHDAAAIIGVNPYLTKIDVWEKLVYKKTKPFRPNNRILRGCRLENILIDLVVAELGDDSSNYFKQYFRLSKTYDFLGGTADAFNAKNKILIEVKTTSKKEISDLYLAQISHYASIFFPDKIYLAIFYDENFNFNSKKYGLLIKEYNFLQLSDYIEIIQKECVSFYYNYVTTKIKPPLQ